MINSNSCSYLLIFTAISENNWRFISCQSYWITFDYWLWPLYWFVPRKNSRFWHRKSVDNSSSPIQVPLTFFQLFNYKYIYFLRDGKPMDKPMQVITKELMRNVQKGDIRVLKAPSYRPLPLPKQMSLPPSKHRNHKPSISENTPTTSKSGDSKTRKALKPVKSKVSDSIALSSPDYHTRKIHLKPSSINAAFSLHL